MGKSAKFPPLSPFALKAAKEDEAAWAKIDANGAAVREAEARGYARAQAEIVSLLEGAVPKEREMAEARGYARGIEDAAEACIECGQFWGGATSTPHYVAESVALAIRALLTPKGEAK